MKITHFKKGAFTKALFSAVAIGALASGTAHAVGTSADTLVSNTFTLNFEVNSASQPVITNDGLGGNDDPTRFRVDRLIDLNVLAGAETNVAPGEADAVLTYTLTNTGNDTQSFLLTLEDVGGDDFDATGLEIWFDDGTGTFVQYNAGTNVVPVLAADANTTIEVRGDIPAFGAPVVDGADDDVILVAQAADDTTFAAVVADSDGNDILATENVFNDAAGDGASDGSQDGYHSDTTNYNVVEAQVDGSKTVTVVNEGTSRGAPACTMAAPIVAGAYALPGACVEYVITVNNNDVDREATAVAIADNLPDNLTFVDAVFAGFGGGATETEPAGGTVCDGTAATCAVSVTGGTLAQAPNATTPTTGTITIRATID